MPQRDVMETDPVAGEPNPSLTGQGLPQPRAAVAGTITSGFRWQSLGRWEVALVYEFSHRP